MQSEITKLEKSANNMTVYFRNLTVNINSLVGTKKPIWQKMINFMKFIHQKKFKLRREDTYLDSKFNIQMLETIVPLLNLLPSLKEIGLHIENED